MKKILITEEQLRNIIRGAVSDDSMLLEYARVGFLKNLEVYVIKRTAGKPTRFSGGMRAVFIKNC